MNDAVLQANQNACTTITCGSKNSNHNNNNSESATDTVDWETTGKNLKEAVHTIVAEKHNARIKRKSVVVNADRVANILFSFTFGLLGANKSSCNSVRKRWQDAIRKVISNNKKLMEVKLQRLDMKQRNSPCLISKSKFRKTQNTVEIRKKKATEKNNMRI